MTPRDDKDDDAPKSWASLAPRGPAAPSHVAPHPIADNATEGEKHLAFEWLREMATGGLIGPKSQRLAGIAFDEWHRLAAPSTALPLSEKIYTKEEAEKLCEIAVAAARTGWQMQQVRDGKGNVGAAASSIAPFAWVVESEYERGDVTVRECVYHDTKGEALIDQERHGGKVSPLYLALPSAIEPPTWVPLAAKETMKLVKANGFIPWSFKDDPTGGQHVEEMLEKLGRGEITGNKAHRWLGWAQAIVCEKCGVTLAQLKEVNRAASARADGTAKEAT